MLKKRLEETEKAMERIVAQVRIYIVMLMVLLVIKLVMERIVAQVNRW